MNLRSLIAHLQWKKLAYPAVLVLFALAIAAVFVNATSFITTEINLILARDAGGETSSIDIDRYNKIARRIGIAEISRTGAPAAAQIPVTTAIPPAATTTDTAATAPDPHALSIAVYNATGIAGLAGSLKKRLEDAGFTVSKTGNAAHQTTNAVRIKASKKSSLSGLQAALGKDFDTAHAETLPEDEGVDCVIVIGKP